MKKWLMARAAKPVKKEDTLFSIEKVYAITPMIQEQKIALNNRLRTSMWVNYIRNPHHPREMLLELYGKEVYQPA